MEILLTVANGGAWSWVTSGEVWAAFFTLTLLEIVLGVDNIVFISILSERLPQNEQKKARLIGLALAMIMRIGLLFSLSWLLGLDGTLFTVLANEISARDLILILGGLFLLVKSTREVHHHLEGEEAHSNKKVGAAFLLVLVQIVLLDIVFSLDSVITAIGMAEQLGVMVAAVVIAVLVMMAAAGKIHAIVQSHPTLKVLALSFLLLIGLALVADGLDHHIPKGYIYFAMGFSVFVEMINLRASKKTKPVELRSAYSISSRKPQ